MNRLNFESLKNLIDLKLSYKDIAEKLQVSKWRVIQDCKFYRIRSLAGNTFTEEQLQKMSLKKKESWLNGKYKNRQSLTSQIKEQISKTVTNRWQEGVYNNRCNGMSGKFNVSNPTYKDSLHYRQKLFFYSPQNICELYGKNLLVIGTFEPSSKMCSCGYINKELTLADREWTCPVCKIKHDRDILAANNIKKFALGKTRSAGPEELVDSSSIDEGMKQEVSL